MSINRITTKDDFVKGFEGRTKKDEVALHDLTKDQHRIVVETLENKLGDMGWLPDGFHVWRLAKGHSTAFSANLDPVRKIVTDVLQGKEKVKINVKPEQPVKKERKKPAPRPKKVYATPEEEANKMEIHAEQRKRKTVRLKVEDALDAYVIDPVKSRRMLKMPELKEVAAANGAKLTGKDNGHVKMNLQNVLAGMYRQFKPVIINGKEYVITEQELEAWYASRGVKQKKGS